MRNFLQVTLAWAALVAWLVASGVSADLLQVFAFADHVAKGVAVTAKDHCGPCLAVDAARDASDHAAPAKHEVAKIKVKADGAVWSVRLPSAAPAASPSFVEILALVRYPEMIREVPVPPPKATV